MTIPTIVKVDGVSKRFILHKDKSLKERVVNFGRARKHRDDFWALDDVSLDIKVGTTIGLVGHNGSGKSTLLKVIGGIIEPSSGSVSRRGRMAALLELGAGFHPDLTGRENVYLNSAILGLTRKETDKYFDAIVDFSGIAEFIDTQVKFYSSGMYVRLAFAVAVHVDPDLLLVDEVLAVGDEPFQRRCMEKIAEFQREGRTIVLVSHSAEQVEQLCDRVVVLDHGKLIQDGSAEEGIRVLRAGFERERIEKEKASGLTNQLAGRIIDLKSTISSEPTGSSISLQFSYELEQSFDALVAGISINTPAGQEAFGITSKDLALTVPADAGQHGIEFVLHNQSIGAGHYIVKGMLVDPESGETVHSFQAYSVLVVEPRYPGTGMVAIKTTTAITDFAVSRETRAIMAHDDSPTAPLSS